MKILIKLLHLIYAGLLRLYPRRFREQFADEMQAVFERVLNDSVSTSGQFLLTVVREFGGLPANLLWQHWLELTKVTHGVAGYLEDERPSSWPEAILTALPYGAIILVSFVQFGPYTAPIFLITAVLAVIVAWRRKRPRWSAGWLSLLLFVGVSFLSSFIYMFAGEWNTPQTLVVHLVGEVLLPVGLGIVLYAVYQYDTLNGMLMVLFLFLFTNPFALEFVPQPLNTIVRGGTQIVIMVTALWLARRGRRTTGVGLMVGASILIGLALSITAEYGNSFTSSTGSVVNVVRGFLPNMLSSLALLFGPLLLRAVWDIARRSGPPGPLGHWLAVLGLALVLAGMLGSYRLFLPDDIAAFRENVSIWFTAAIWGGIALYVGGLALTGLAARRSGLPLNLKLFSLLAGLLFTSLFVFQLPGIIATRALPALVPGVNNLIYARQLSELWTLALGSTLGLLWLALGFGVIALLSHKAPTAVVE